MRRARPLLAAWSVVVLLLGLGVAASRAGDEPRADVAAAGGDAEERPTSTTATPTTTVSSTTTTTAPRTSVTSSPPRRSGTTATTTAPTPAPSDPGEVPMPPGPWEPYDHMPAGYVPRVNDGYVTVTRGSPQVEDRITHVPGQPYTLRGRVTDERGNLLSGICVRVDHPDFGQVVTGPDGIFQFTTPGWEGTPDMPGVPWHIYDCNPGDAVDWAAINTYLTRATPGDTSTWFWRLSPASRFQGRVLSAETGLGVSGICIVVPKGAGPDHAPARSAPTDTTGRFTVDLVGGWDQHVEAVPCGRDDGWSVEPTYLPFRPGYTVVQDVQVTWG